MIGRPYKLVHIVRDPVDAVMSADLYETQRVDAHDRYHRRRPPPSPLFPVSPSAAAGSWGYDESGRACRLIRPLNTSEALGAMTTFMLPELEVRSCHELPAPPAAFLSVRRRAVQDMAAQFRLPRRITTR